MADNDVKIKVSVDGADTAAKGLKGIGDGASEADGKTSKLAGGLKGAGVAVLGFAGAAVAAGGALAIGVTKAYSDYQQNVGGIQTMFGASAGKMQQYAQDAYKTAGLSANDYMSQATSFSAALLQGLGGDTNKAADVANRAMTDMSDNANKFGTNIGMIQNAYQGFAKNNYTMLDNLKLGYGGTAAEMARLVNDSGVMGSSFKATAANINSVSYDKVIAAIGAVQDKMGVTGTTAREAASTISGSIGMLKGSWENLLVGLGDSNQDVGKLATQVVDSLQSVVTNVTPVITAIGAQVALLGPQLGDLGIVVVNAVAAAIPAVLQAGIALIGGLLQGIQASLPGLITAIIPAVVGLVGMIATMAPQLITAGMDAIVALASGIGLQLPTLIPLVVTGIMDMILAITDELPMLLQAATTLFMGLVQGVIAAIPYLIEVLPTIITSIVTFIAGALPMIVQAGITLLLGLVAAIPPAITAIVAVLPQIITSITTALLVAIPMLINAGVKLLTSLVTALPQIIQTIVTVLPQIITAVITAILGALPLLVNAGLKLFIALIQALPTIIVTIVNAIPQIIMGIINALIRAVPELVMAGVMLLVALVKNMPAIIGGIIGAVPQIIGALIGAIAGMVPQMAGAGLHLIQGLWQGISDAASWILGKIGGFVNQVMGGIKDFFGIHSPSKRMADEIGAFLPAGIGMGIDLHINDAINPLKNMNANLMAEAQNLKADVALTATQHLVPSSATPTAAAPGSIQASLNPDALTGALADAFAAHSATPQAPVNLSRDSIRTLASAIVDSVRVQSRQGVSALG